MVTHIKRILSADFETISQIIIELLMYVLNISLKTVIEKKIGKKSNNKGEGVRPRVVGCMKLQKMTT